jgi:hypothetical protein
MAKSRTKLDRRLLPTILALAFCASAAWAADGTPPAATAAPRAAEATAPTVATPTTSAAATSPASTGAGAPKTPKLDELPLKEGLTRGGITWTFDKPARAGQFINGDWYVVGPVTVKAIDPKPLFGEEVKTPLMEQGDTKESLFKGQVARNGSTLNVPAVVPPSRVTPRTQRSGFDSRMPAAAYDPNQFTPLPIAMKPGDSLVSSISDEPVPYGGYPVKALSVLTCVEAPLPPDAFRPSFCQTRTSGTLLGRNLRRDLLLKLPRPASAAKVRPADFAVYFNDVWMDTVGFGRAMPRQKFAFNGAGIAGAGGGASLLLLLDYSAEEKEPLLINLVQEGIDLYGLVRGGGGWAAEGICGSGRKWIIVFAGLMTGDPNMSAVSKTYPDAEFQEDEQTAWLPIEYDGKKDGGKKFDKTWTGAKVFWTGHYGIRLGQWPPNKWAGGYGPVELFPPAEWPSPWPRSESDRRSTSSPQWVGEALAARLMHAEAVWGHDAFFAYVDRWMTEDDSKALEEIKKNIQTKLSAKPDPTAEEKKLLESLPNWAPVRQGTIEGPAELIPVMKDLWVKYRDNLPPAPGGAKTPPAEQTWK